MIVDTVLNSCKTLIGQQITECSIAIEDGKIMKIAKQTHMPKADQTFDIHNKLVLPGVIDTHVHLRDQENGYKETFLTGTSAAANGGVTTVLDMPNNKPVTMSPQTLMDRIRIAEQSILVNTGFYSEFPNHPSSIEEIVKAGAIGFKLFMANQTGGLNPDDDQQLKEAFTKASKQKIPIAVHAEEGLLLAKNVNKLKLTGRDDIAAFQKAHSQEVEAEAIRRIIKITKEIEINLHFCHISTQIGLEIINKAKESSQHISCELTPHHLLLSKETYETWGAMALTMPPLRSREDVTALRKGILENRIDLIGSDHAPHTKEEKEANSVWNIKPGIPGLETTLPLILTMVHRGMLSLPQLVTLLSEKPAEIFNLRSTGKIEKDKQADLVVVDFNKEYKIDPSKFKSKAHFSPFENWEVKGKPIKTFANGQLIMDQDQIVAKPGSAKIIRRPI